MSFLANLLPSEDKFHVLMRSMSSSAQASVLLLKQFTETDIGSGRDKIGRDIAHVRGESKELVARVAREVSLSFITPFDREDIQAFCEHLYKIPKTVDKIRERLELHDIASENGDFTRQIDLIVQEAAAMEEIVEALTHRRTQKTIVDKVAHLHTLEADGDEVLSDLLKNLFKGNRDVRDLILRKDIYDMLEKVLDRYRDAAGVALQIILKHT